jgi:uncharacterized protein YecT (DUF1311 family)
MEHWYGGEYRKCDGTTVEIVDCLIALRDSWDARLNKAYQQIMRTASENGKTLLRDAQRKWIAYRDANCTYYANGEGSIARIEAGACFYVLTRDRALELELAGKQY